ncbi:2Fe-2S iron-sulfur cluster-binding protein [Chthonobacter rhizosphaerae]|uniref:2Fe-2S iron-sulfur cluster-binding protein n=1 Tax=Chthonobacter rhizosphaerae TaxID=2735553 RepID=UPI001FEC6A68|nr:2Fe-2S iron-sulfur cluster-binding protein [Chthonobacter rhizosphaerae]
MLTFVMPDGTQRTIRAAAGLNVLYAAALHDVPHLCGECAGEGVCGSCQVLVEAATGWTPPERSPEEELALGIGRNPDRGERRLACMLAAPSGAALRMRIPPLDEAGRTR